MLNATELEELRILTDNPRDPRFRAIATRWCERWQAHLAYPLNPDLLDHAGARRELRQFIENAELVRAIHDPEHPAHTASLKRFRSLLGAIAP